MPRRSGPHWVLPEESPRDRVPDTLAKKDFWPAAGLPRFLDQSGDGQRLIMNQIELDAMEPPRNSGPRPFRDAQE